MNNYTETLNYSVVFAPGLEELIKKKNAPHNYKKGERQTVYPFKRQEDIINVANWLMENKSKKYVLAFTLGVNLGLRANELLSLRFEQLYWPDGSLRYIPEIEDTSDMVEIYQSKTKKYRTVFLNEECKAALEWYFPYGIKNFDFKEYIFSSREGGCIKVDTFRKVLKDAASACGVKINIGTHSLRKTWGWHQYKYNCERANLDITKLQRAFGHSSPEVTLRYLGITDEEDKALYHDMCINVVTDTDFTDKVFLVYGEE